MTRILIIAVATLLVAGFDVARDDRGHRLRWPDREVAVFLEATPLGRDEVADFDVADLEAALQEAIGTWNRVEGSRLRLVYGGLCRRSPGFDIFVAFGDSGFQQRGDDFLSKLGVSAGADGLLRRVSVKLDAQHVEFVKALKLAKGPIADLQAVLTHVLGRAVGLDLSSHDDATMYFLPLTPAARRLSADDDKAASWAYPSGPKPASGLCEPCDGNTDCPGGFCATFKTGRKSYCLRGCDGHDDCPVGYSCGSWTAGTACFPNEGHCAPALAHSPPSGPCASDSACDAELQCLPTRVGAFCTAGCPSGFCGAFGTCRQAPGINTGGVPLCLRGLDRGVGQPCRTATQCQSMVCAPSLTRGGRCSLRCAGDSSCPGGYRCDRGTPDALCVKTGTLAIGWPCGSGFDCQSGICAAAAGPFSKVCSKTCKATTDCPAGTGCTPANGDSLCLPYGGPALGSPCAAVGACGSSRVCDRSPLPGIGTCRYACDPFGDDHECLNGGRCAWVGSISPKLGACRGGAGGGLVGASCSAALPCRQDLLCVGADGATGTCRRDCRVGAEAGCEAGEHCVELDLTDPEAKVRPGACVRAAGSLVVVQPLTKGEAGGNFAAISVDMSGEVLPWGSTFAEDADQQPGASAGCAATAGSGAAVSGLASLALLASVVLMLLAARHRTPP